jgi:hypothetical protein
VKWTLLGYEKENKINGAITALRVLSSDTKLRVVRWKSTDVSKEHVTSIFRVQNNALLATSSTPVSCMGWFSALKMQETHSSETSVVVQRNTKRYNPEDWTLHSNRCENLRTYIFTSLIWNVDIHSERGAYEAQCNVEVGYHLNICSSTEENRGQTFQLLLFHFLLRT